MDNFKTEEQIFNETMLEIVQGRRIMHKVTMESNLLESATTGYLSEELIKTYPIEKVIKTMSECFDLVLTTEKRNPIKDSQNFNHNGTINIAGDKKTGEVIIIAIKKSDYNKKKMDICLNKYGYFCGNKRDNGIWEWLQYEKKFDTDVTNFIENLGYVYHICPGNLKEKILKQGLTPHDSKWKTFSNDPRLYFFYGKINFQTFSSWANNFRMNKEQNVNEYLLLKINIKKLTHKIKFYLDPRMKNGVYTLEGIHHKQ